MMIDNPDLSCDDLMKVIKGPDFPTGGLIKGDSGIKDMYRTGRGSIVVRAKATIENIDASRQRIVVTEVPYMVNKARMLEKIAELVRDKKIEGISDLRDESDRRGIRVVIDLKRDANARVVLNQLYKHTQMQSTFGAIMLALVDNKPRVLNLRDIIYHYLEHQKDVIVRRTRFDLARAEERIHILEGLKIALDNIDEVIAIIRASKDDATAKDALIKAFGLSEKQAQVILDMRLRRLTALEREKIDEEYEELLKKVEYYKKVLSDEKLVLSIIREEILEIKSKFADGRRTQISYDEADLDIEDLIAEEEIVITQTYYGYVKRMPLSAYRSQRRGGRGVTGITTRDEDFVEHIFIGTTHHVVMFFTNQGNVYRLKAYEIPEASRTARGTAIVNLIPLKPGERVNGMITIKGFDEARYLIFVTKNGTVKKTLLSEYDSSRKTGIIAISLREDDELIGVRLVDKNDEIILGTKLGMSIRFSVNDVSAVGRTAYGVKGITLREGDELVSMDIITPEKDVLVVTQQGFGKRTDEREFRAQGRGGKGVILQKVTDKTGPVASLRVVGENDEIMLCTASGIMIRMMASDISKMSRNTRGVTLIKLEKDDIISSMAVVTED